MIRILHVVASDQRRGAEIFASDLVRSLNDGEVAQHVAILRGSGGTGVGFDAPITVLTSTGGRVPGLRVDLGRVRSLRRLIRAWGPNVIQAHGGEALKYTVLGSTAVPLVYRRIGEVAPRIQRGPSRMAHSALMRRSDRVVAVAEAVREETVRTFRLPPRRAITIAGGVDSRRLDPQRPREAVRGELGIPTSARALLSLGALSSEKDPLAHVRVGESALSGDSEAVHILAGDGPLRGAVESAVRASPVRDRFKVLGNRADVGDLLEASDLMIFASRTEGMPACLIEAGMTGLPVVAYSVAGVSEVVIDGVTGILVRPGDETALSRSVRDLLRDERARRAIGSEAERWCRSRFDMDVVAPRYLELYHEIAA